VASDRGGAWHPRWFWPAFAAPGMVWLVVLFLLPFYVVLSIAFGVNLLESDGMVNRLLVSAGLLGEPFPWLAGQPVTVTLGLVYGYIPYMVLALYAGLDRVDQRLLEAARDLGASRRRTFLLVTLPLSRQAILAGLVVTSLPMFGDYFTNDLLSGSPRTSMVGNLVNDAIGSPGQGGQAAALVLVMIALLAVPMLGYVRSTARASREAGR
jgi:ABC-type spermidine/putrescine transport system permease subunit I